MAWIAHPARTQKDGKVRVRSSNCMSKVIGVENIARSC